MLTVTFFSFFMNWLAAGYNEANLGPFWHSVKLQAAGYSIAVQAPMWHSCFSHVALFTSRISLFVVLTGSWIYCSQSIRHHVGTLCIPHSNAYFLVSWKRWMAGYVESMQLPCWHSLQSHIATKVKDCHCGQWRSNSPLPNFMKLLSRKYCLANFLSKQTN